MFGLFRIVLCHIFMYLPEAVQPIWFGIGPILGPSRSAMHPCQNEICMFRLLTSPVVDGLIGWGISDRGLVEIWDLGIGDK